MDDVIIAFVSQDLLIGKHKLVIENCIQLGANKLQVFLILGRTMLTIERLSLTFTANGKNKTFAICLQLSVQ